MPKVTQQGEVEEARLGDRKLHGCPDSLGWAGLGAGRTVQSISEEGEEEGQRRQVASGLVGAYGLLDPGGVLADMSVDSGVWDRAAGVSAPGQDALQGPITHQRATGVTLNGAEVGGMSTPLWGLSLWDLGWCREEGEVGWAWN